MVDVRVIIKVFLQNRSLKVIQTTFRFQMIFKQLDYPLLQQNSFRPQIFFIHCFDLIPPNLFIHILKMSFNLFLSGLPSVLCLYFLHL